MGKVLQFLLRPLSDEKYLKVYWFKRFRKPLDLEHPRTFNEKLQWLKLYYRKSEFSGMVDKAEAKKYVASIIGERYIIPTYGVWDRFEDIDFSSLPDSFVLKATNGGGNNGVVVCRDKSSLNMRKARWRINAAMRHNLYLAYREFPYRDIRPRIIAEQLLGDGTPLTDYKFFCFNGHVETILVCLERRGHHSKKYYFDIDWNLQRLTWDSLRLPDSFTLPRPSRLEEMTSLASRLSAGFPFIRVDLYQVGDDVRFSELTFYTNSGYGKDRLPEVDMRLGDLIILPEKTI